MALTVKIRGDATDLEKTLKKVNKSVSGLGAGLGRAAMAGAGFAAALAGINTAEAVITKLAGLVQDSSMKAAGVESLTMQFETLLGSAQAAQERMAEIKRFAASTPFEVANLSATSKLLQTLGGDMLATGEGLRMVGDAAAIAGQPIQEVGLHIGRIFNAITSGTSAGESVNRMQELGLMTGTVKRRFEELAEAQKKGVAQTLTSEQALKLLKDTFKSTEGAMARLAMTTEGKLSNLQDNIDNLKVAFGTGFNDGLKNALNATNATLPALETSFSQFGEIVGKTITDGVNGNYDIILQAGILIGKTLKEGALMAMSDLPSTIIRDLLTSDKSLSKEDRQKEQAAIDRLIGPQRTPEQFASDLKYVTAGERKSFEETVMRRDNERMIEELVRNRQAVERLLEKGIKVTRENIAQEIYSR